MIKRILYLIFERLSLSLLITLCFFTLTCLGQNTSIIPIPVSQQQRQGAFELTASTVLVVPSKQAEIQKVASYLAAEVKRATGFSLQTSENAGASAIQFVLNAKTDAKLGSEGYLLETNPGKVIITANTASG